MDTSVYFANFRAIKQKTMKKIFTSIFTLTFIGVAAIAQETTSSESAGVADDHDKNDSKKVQCSAFWKTGPVRDLIKSTPSIDEDSYYDNWVPREHKRMRYSEMTELDDFGIPENGNIDPALQTAPAFRTESWTKAQWTGQSGAVPPDPTGAVGQDYYVQMVNSTYRIFDKEGNPESGGPKPLNSLLGSGDGDPIVMYDRYAERWFVSQFRISGNKILIGISETSDPLGDYYIYEWSFVNFPDYPKYSVWSNAYFMTANMTNSNCVAFEREKMLVGDPTASMIQDNFPSHFQFFRSQGTAYAEGPTAPDADEPGWFFSVQENAWTGSITTDHIKIWRYDLDWDAGTGDVVLHQELDVDAHNCVFTSSWNDLTQKGTSQKLDAVAGIFMYKVQYRRFTDYNVAMLCTTVDVDGGNRAGIRWYELREENDGVWYVHQQGTWSPDSENNRWMGSIAMDAQGNIALAYSFCGPDEYPGIRYTGRFWDDPLNQMTVQEQIAVEGTGAQTIANRWGDYAQMTMDPTDDMTFWYTGEWHSTTRKTEIISFSSWHLVGDEDNRPLVPLFNAYQPSSAEMTLQWQDISDEIVTITLIDMSGKLLAEDKINTKDSNELTYDISERASGIYMLHMTGPNTSLSKKVYIGR